MFDGFLSGIGVLYRTVVMSQDTGEVFVDRRVSINHQQSARIQAISTQRGSGYHAWGRAKNAS